MAQIVSLHPTHPEGRKINQILETLIKGGVIIYPTDTIYAVGCDIQSPRAIEKVARIKGIKPEKANFSIACRDLSDLSEYTRPLPQNVFRLMKASLPGPYTFILPAGPAVPRMLHSNRKSIGIRVPDNVITQAILEALGRPILTSSLHADDQIQEYPTEVEDLERLYGHQVDIIVDGGPGQNVPSTIIDCLGDQPVITRVGAGDPDIL